MSYVVTFGKFNGKSIDTINLGELLSYAGYLVKRATEEGKPLSRSAYEYTKEVMKYAQANLDKEIKAAAQRKEQAPPPAKEEDDSIPF